MDELHVGKKSAYEDEVRELYKRLNCKGLILIVIDGNKTGADHYEVASVIRGEGSDMMKLPYMLMALAQKFMEDIKKMVRPDSNN